MGGPYASQLEGVGNNVNSQRSQDFSRHNTGCHPGRGLPGRIPSSSSEIKVAVFLEVAEISVTGTEDIPQDIVWPAVHIPVLNEKGDGCAGGLVLENAGEDIYLVLFFSGGFQSMLPRPAPRHVINEVLWGERDFRRTSVDDNPHTISMGFPKGGDFKDLSK